MTDRFGGRPGRGTEHATRPVEAYRWLTLLFTEVEIAMPHTKLMLTPGEQDVDNWFRFVDALEFLDDSLTGSPRYISPSTQSIRTRSLRPRFFRQGSLPAMR